MKITTKTSREELKMFLGANAKLVRKADKDLYDRIAYADKMEQKDESKVQRKDLVDLAKEVMQVLGDQVVEITTETPVENSVKKLNKGVSKKQEASEKAEPKTAKKSKDGVTPLAETSSKAVQLAEIFPEAIEVGDTHYEQAKDIKNIDDLYKALGKDEEIVFAFYWSKRHLKQFPYFEGIFGQPKSFDLDLDLATTIYVSDEKKVSYQVSMYTEALYMVLPESIKEIDGIRMSNGIEFQIYRAV